MTNMKTQIFEIEKGVILLFLDLILLEAHYLEKSQPKVAEIIFKEIFDIRNSTNNIDSMEKIKILYNDLLITIEKKSPETGQKIRNRLKKHDCSKLQNNVARLNRTLNFIQTTI